MYLYPQMIVGPPVSRLRRTVQFHLRNHEFGTLFCRPVGRWGGIVTLVVALAGGGGASSSFAGSDPSAPGYAVSAYDMYSGLPSHAVQFTYQTSDGYIWFGSESGLARFDGSRFVTYRTSNTPELPANHIRVLHEDRQHRLWIGTQGGLCVLENGRFTRIAGLTSRVADVKSDDRGSVWIGTNDAGLLEYRNGKIVSHADDPGMPAEKDIRWLYFDSTGRMWLLFRTGNPMCFRDGRATQPPEASSWPAGIVQIAEGPAGTFWVASSAAGILRVQGDERRLFPLEQFGGEPVRLLACDRENQLWVLTNRFYVLKPGREKFEPFVINGVENCRGFMEDHEGSYWIGSAADGAIRLRPSGFSMMAPLDRPFGGNTRTIVYDRDGTLWAGSPGSGFVRMRPDGSITSYEVPLTGSDAEVWSICPAHNGDVWIGCRGGVVRLRDGVMERMSNMDRVRAVFEDRAGTVWIGSESGGVDYYRDGAFVSFVSKIEAAQAAPSRPVGMAFAEGSDGTLYIGLRENGGLVTIKDGKVTCAQDLPSNDIRCVYPDKDGNLWIGTKGRGLIVRRQGKWLNPPAFAEVFFDPVAAIMEDAYGRLWLGTAKGVVSANKAQLLVSAQTGGEVFSRLATERDGIRPATIGGGYYPAYTQAPDGTMLFASRQGVVRVDPQKISLNRVPPPVNIESVEADNRPIVPNVDRRVVVPAGTHSLTIDYSAVSFIGPTQLRFRYRLLGRDADWIEAGSRRTATFGELPPGTYRFHVRACNEDGVWNETGASLLVVQLPFFYQTKWFYAVATAALLGVAVGFVRWRTSSLRGRNLELERRIAERTAELARSYDTIRASEFFYHSLVESLPQIIARKDAEGRYTYVNTPFASLVGRPPEQIVGRLDSDLFPAARAEKHRADDRRVMETRQPLEYETVVEHEGRKVYYHVKNVPLHDAEGRTLGVQVLSWDMTSIREIEDKLKQAQHELVETSRLAGIAEMATGVLHNLGNALNSVTTAAGLLSSRLYASKVGSVGKIADLLAEQNGQLVEFLTTDRRGRQLPEYLRKLGDLLREEHRDFAAEVDALQKNIDHIKELVAAQQQYARVGGLTEVISPAELVEFALRLCEASMARHQIAIVRELMPAPAVKVERQKALQVIGNLLTNAREAMPTAGQDEKRIVVGVRTSAEGRTQIYVTDNGTGIAPENLTRIFAFGFTTKKHGHGFGLHSSALVARELGGSLTVTSAGLGKGATFLLELPPADLEAN